jgi:hypothetical protein
MIWAVRPFWACVGVRAEKRSPKAGCSVSEVVLAREHFRDPGQAPLDFGGTVEVPGPVCGGGVLRAPEAAFGERVVDAVLLAGEVVVGTPGDVGEFFPPWPLSI